MQKKIVYVLILMSVCVLGITGLQLYWNYQNYKKIVHNFKTGANVALEQAVDKEIDFRQQQFVAKVKHWLADTSFISIECNMNNRDSATVFIMQDVHPRFLEDTSRKTKFYQVGISKFTKKLKKITPDAKTIFINHFAERIFKRDIKNANIFFYTQGLGDSITKIVEASKLDFKRLDSIYKIELQQKEIYCGFSLNSKYVEKKGHF